MTSHDGDGPTPERTTERPGKRRRQDVARQACERCRVKKTRCDEQFPCGLCRSLGVECVYSYRKPSRSELSSDTLLRILGRLESKVDSLTTKTPTSSSHATEPWAADGGEQAAVYENPPSSRYISPSAQDVVEETAPRYPQSAIVPWSAHQVLAWKPVLSMLPEAVQLLVSECGIDYSTSLELHRRRLPLGVRPGGKEDPEPLGNLSVSLVKELCDSYFATFHLTYPIVDRTFFLRHTLPAAIHGDFGYDVESCVVLVVMALGCWAKGALREASEFRTHSRWASSSHGGTYEDKRSNIDGSTPGLVFFNDARKRIGWLINGNCMQSCQYYLLSGLYYAQLVRPVDWWTMTARASTCCRMFWENVPNPCDEWIADMQSRLFWNVVMFDAILSQELKLPGCQLDDMAQRIPLPKFVRMKQPSFLPVDSETDEEESFFQYHFLAQVAHRILLTRTKTSIFVTSEYSSQSVAEELHQQLERWRNRLPAALQFDDDRLAPSPDSPGEILVVSWLRFRYIIAKFHFGRPFLHKILSRPKETTDEELHRCTEIFHQIFSWEPIMRVICVMKSCMPLKFFMLFGQLLLVYCFRCNLEPRLHQVLPARYHSWCAFALSFLQEAAPSSPTLAKDAEIATILCQDLILP
ncbi:Zn(II)2Cys6 transcription factor [Aspergillus lucknowensis]|uniref:Zn(2)-C6 fungal-type domain-containing protein n=1 Tax=Aspergillus lucknowensis TaxID=176173 RepID=A0ABR4LTF2_9EURO